MSYVALNRRINVKPLIAVPRGSILPADLETPVITEGSFLEKMFENTRHKIAITYLTTEELIALVEKPHLFGTDVIALVGVPGGRYDAVWSSYIAPLRRISLETLAGETRKILEADETQRTDLEKAEFPRLDSQLGLSGEGPAGLSTPESDPEHI